MGVVKGFFQTVFSKLNIKYTNNDLTVHVKLNRIGDNIDRAQDALDAQVWSDVKQYMPYDTSNLIQRTGDLNANTRGEVYLYDPDVVYAHYQYEGIKYVDPIYMTGAFYNSKYGFWSRPGVTKIISPSRIPLKYTSSTAVSHWGRVAYENHHKQWVDVAKAAARR